MPNGFLVTLGDSTIDPGDTVANTGPASFTSSQLLGPGKVNWTNGGNSLTASGEFHLTSTGDVYFIPGFGPFSQHTGGTAEVTEFNGTQPGMACFTCGTLIDTPRGPVAVEDLREGDLVRTFHDGPQPILWIGRRHLTHDALVRGPRQKPIEVKTARTGHLLRVSPQHALYAAPGGAPMLIRARQLLRLDLPGIRQMSGVRRVEYAHILLPRHGLVRANGLWCETLMPGAQCLVGLTPERRAALLRVVGPGYGPPVAPYATLKDLRALPPGDRAALLGPATRSRAVHAA